MDYPVFPLNQGEADSTAGGAASGQGTAGAAAPSGVQQTGGRAPDGTLQPNAVSQTGVAYVQGPTPAAVIAGQQTATASAAALPSNALQVGVVMKIYVGPSGVTAASGYPLTAGEAISYAVSNTNVIYIIGSNTTDVLAFTGN